MGAWLRCAIPTLPTDILDQHSSVLHILASEEFVAVADLTVSGCRGAINSYSRKRSRIRSKLEHRGVLDKRDIHKLDLASIQLHRATVHCRTLRSIPASYL